MEFVSAINLPHEARQEVSHFLCDHFNFSLIAQDDVSVTVNNGVLSIRFHDSQVIEQRAHLDLETTNMEEGAAYLVSKGFEAIGEVKPCGLFRKEQIFHGPHNLSFTLHQVLSEDDLGILPDLDTSLDWDLDTEEMAKHLLSHVTIHFRNSARKKMVAQAEALALIEGKLEVGQDEMVTAFLYTTPDFKQAALQDLLMENGISLAFIEQQIKNR